MFWADLLEGGHWAWSARGQRPPQLGGRVGRTQGTCRGATPTEPGPSLANYAEHWCSLLRKTETPFGRCHAAVDPAEYYKVGGTPTCAPHLPPSLASRLGAPAGA